MIQSRNISGKQQTLITMNRKTDTCHLPDSKTFPFHDWKCAACFGFNHNLKKLNAIVPLSQRQSHPSFYFYQKAHLFKKSCLCRLALTYWLERNDEVSVIFLLYKVLHPLFDNLRLSTSFRVQNPWHSSSFRYREQLLNLWRVCAKRFTQVLLILQPDWNLDALIFKYRWQLCCWHAVSRYRFVKLSNLDFLRSFEKSSIKDHLIPCFSLLL